VEPTVPHESRRATASPGLFPAINATAYRGPPPSYEEANDPNGILYFFNPNFILRT
jgi:hypothetical protein